MRRSGPACASACPGLMRIKARRRRGYTLAAMSSHLHRTPVVALAALALSLLAPLAQATPAENDEAMLKLATQSGCMACHDVQPAPKRADGLPPIAPAWRDIALKYRDDPAASDRLTRTVMTGSNPQARHWVGRVSDMPMPPNADAVSEADARMLVNWLLVLVP
jgi:cytochrome c